MLLQKLMSEIQSRGTANPAVLAASLNVSIGLVMAMLEDLERRGMLKRMDTDCGTACGGCSPAAGCAKHNLLGSKLWVVASSKGG